MPTMIPATELYRGIKQLVPINDVSMQDEIRAKINKTCRAVTRPIRLGTDPEYNTQPLFEISGEVDYALVRGDYDKIIGRIEVDRLQDIALQVMTDYGFDPSIAEPEYTTEEGWSTDGSLHRADGTSIEVLNYPSQTIPGLTFQRKREFTTETGDSFHVSWKVLDRAGVQFDLKKLLR